MHIGHLKLPEKPVVLAPMEDITDISFRLICKRLGADLVFTEFTSCEALIRDVQKAREKIRFLESERPVAVQIFGGRESAMADAARVAEELRPDIIDINCGCWVKNLALRGEGAGLLRDLKRFEAIVRATVKATRLPVTVKTRLGWDQKNIVICDVARMVEQTGAAALTVHCRTREQGHKGKADWQWLEKVKRVIRIPLIGNGDVLTPRDAERMLATGCDGVMIGRGAIQNPWIFTQVKNYLETGRVTPEVSLTDRINLCLEHLRLSVQYKGQWKGVVDFRKHYSGYLRGVPFAAKLRSEIMTMMSPDQIAAALHYFLRQRRPCVCAQNAVQPQYRS